MGITWFMALASFMLGGLVIILPPIGMLIGAPIYIKYLFGMLFLILSEIIYNRHLLEEINKKLKGE
jgi:hypothetical protein